MGKPRTTAARAPALSQGIMTDHDGLKQPNKETKADEPKAAASPDPEPTAAKDQAVVRASTQQPTATETAAAATATTIPQQTQPTPLVPQPQSDQTAQQPAPTATGVQTPADLAEEEEEEKHEKRNKANPKIESNYYKDNKKLPWWFQKKEIEDFSPKITGKDGKTGPSVEIDRSFRPGGNDYVHCTPRKSEEELVKFFGDFANQDPKPDKSFTIYAPVLDENGQPVKEDGLFSNDTKRVAICSYDAGTGKFYDLRKTKAEQQYTVAVEAANNPAPTQDSSKPKEQDAQQARITRK
ncbi:MAG: hypothetical protein A3F18_01095 [Legionellales bacterium RIFCSPHIGHO2_12_FULL_37_14]|nr:MAG: hypothetical protein A3F18_01095 [Legionellales bacterium RIFCSPHIGHO2_12_FULL_37_14]